ncbi:hypothetical protein T12_5452 [Trichinella patagoniensis]|uniref:Uncharacterized protein n=1 Tax=Trichinella patagoniensis TaxID=990121 RepID=A0A0V0Y1R7_9BILA|nr:hypothetical protein T12_5452 [Trichinella patagoniensis]
MAIVICIAQRSKPSKCKLSGRKRHNNGQTLRVQR